MENNPYIINESETNIYSALIKFETIFNEYCKLANSYLLFLYITFIYILQLKIIYLYSYLGSDIFEILELTNKYLFYFTSDFWELQEYCNNLDEKLDTIDTIEALKKRNFTY